MEEEIRLASESRKSSRGYPAIMCNSVQFSCVPTRQFAADNIRMRGGIRYKVGIEIDAGGHGREVVNQNWDWRRIRDVVEEFGDGWLLHCASC